MYAAAAATGLVSGTSVKVGDCAYAVVIENASGKSTEATEVRSACFMMNRLGNEKSRESYHSQILSSKKEDQRVQVQILLSSDGLIFSQLDGLHPYF